MWGRRADKNTQGLEQEKRKYGMDMRNYFPFTDCLQLFVRFPDTISIYDIVSQNIRNDYLRGTQARLDGKADKFRGS